MNTKLQISSSKISTSSTMEFGMAVMDQNQMDLAKKRAEHIRWKAIENLEKNLLEYESKALKKGFKIIWCENTQDAENEVQQILKSYTSKQIKFHHPTNNFDVFGTQNILKNLEKSIQNNISVPSENEYLKHISIACTQTIVAENGSVIFESNNNEISEIAKSDILIAIAPIHQIAVSQNDAEYIGSLKNAVINNEFISSTEVVFNKLSEKENELLVPKEIYILLLDNGFESFLEDTETRKALYCIDCGKCAQVCPVVNTPNQTHSLSPIHSLVNAVKNPKNDQYSSFSNLCSMCSKVCPVNIPIHQLLQKQRSVHHLSLHPSTTEGLFKAAMKKSMLNRKFMNQNVKLKSFMFNNLIPKNYKYRKFLPEFSDKTFNELWKEKHK